MSSPFERIDEPWGEGDAMSALEAAMWRAETDPSLRSHGVVLELLDTTPDWDRLVAAHEWAVRRLPRLRQRVVDDPLHVGPPAWVGTEVDLGYHLRRTLLGAGADLQDALEIAAALHMGPFDPARPLWACVLVEGLPDGKAALLIKLHHSYADGTAVVQMLDLLHSDRREPTPDKPALPAPVVEDVGPSDVLVRNVLRGTRGTARSLLGAVREGVERSARAVRDPRKPVAETVHYARSLVRVTGAAPGTPSPLMARRGLARRLATIDVPLADLRAGGRAAGGTLNDAFVAGLAGGYRLYHAEQGARIPDVPMALPVSLRRSGDGLGGNKFTGARIAAPTAESDPARRIAIARERVLAARGEPALDFLGLTAPLMSRAPGPLLARLTASFTRSTDLQASNFRGLDREAYVAGARVERMFPFGPSPGCGLMATLVSHGGRCCIGLTIDTAAVTDPELMVRCLERGFAEVLSLAAPEPEVDAEEAV